MKVATKVGGTEVGLSVTPAIAGKEKLENIDKLK